MIPADQAQRDRFAQETGRNFSVIAPAGVGKTTAIAARVLAVAKADETRFRSRQPLALPSLVVVTFTRKAADELRDRARRALARAGLEAHVMQGFNRAFFGTIHSFCLELLRRFGPLAALPTRFTLESDRDARWLAFRRDTADASAFLPEAARADWRRYGEEQAIWQLAETWPNATAVPPVPEACPEPDFAPLRAFQPKRRHQGADENLRRDLARLQRWQDELAAGGHALGVPAITRGHREFQELWNRAFAPLRAWLAGAAAHAGAGLAAAFTRFQQDAGRLGYDDFVRLALRLLRDPAVAERVRAVGYSVLLDEAQDTDPAQFAVLVGVAHPAGAPGLWTEGAGRPPAPGRFSMVGDPQQAIYSRADVAAYQALHRQLVAADAAEELTFSVTMRCDEAIVAGVNEVFPAVLHGRDGQARFVPLTVRPQAGEGWLGRLAVAPPERTVPDNLEARVRAEAEALAGWLRVAAPAGLGVDHWGQVAVLAPRRDWLQTLASALRAQSLRVQVHVSERAPGADPARTWLAALLGVLADPADAFEIAGVLREIFGVSDDALLRASTHYGLSILSAPPAEATGAVAAALAQLHRVRRDTAELPLRDAVARAVAGTRLRERLAALPETTAETSTTALDALLDQTALAEARGETLAEFARTLRAGPREAVEPVARAGELQLLTCHKAKGLEWPAVILFGLFCEPGFARPSYPRWLPPSRFGAPPTCAYDKDHAATGPGADARRAEEAARRAEFVRLLYVAATRPRRVLLMVDAETLGADERSLAGVLGLLEGAPARGWWKSLPTVESSIVLENELVLSNVSTTAAAPRWPAPVAPPGLEALEAARARAVAGVRRVRPSALARHPPAQANERAEPDWLAPPEYPEETLPAAAAVQYGNWWHGVMETTPWPAGPTAWAAHWERQAALAPDAERAAAELARLRQSPLAARLAATELHFVAELPFLWTEPDRTRAYDGCIDLAVWDEAAHRWLVVDWKTDRAESDPAAELRARYGPQLAVYARTLADVYGAPVEAVLYGTRAGVAVTIDF
jgi:ATP-dependent exoDNAse (exonuclease V) beta subunit